MSLRCSIGPRNGTGLSVHGRHAECRASVSTKTSSSAGGTPLAETTVGRLPDGDATASTARGAAARAAVHPAAGLLCRRLCPLLRCLTGPSPDGRWAANAQKRRPGSRRPPLQCAAELRPVEGSRRGESAGCAQGAADWWRNGAQQHVAAGYVITRTRLRLPWPSSEKVMAGLRAEVNVHAALEVGRGSNCWRSGKHLQRAQTSALLHDCCAPRTVPASVLTLPR